MNVSGDFLFRLKKDPKEKIKLKFREVFPTKPIELNTESTGTAHEERVFLDSRDQHETTEKNSGSVYRKHEAPYQPSHQSSRCLVIMLMT